MTKLTIYVSKETAEELGGVIPPGTKLEDYARRYIEKTAPRWLHGLEGNAAFPDPTFRVKSTHLAGGKPNRLVGSFEFGPEDKRQDRPLTVSAGGAGLVVAFEVQDGDKGVYVAMRSALRAGIPSTSAVGIAGGTNRLPNESDEAFARRNFENTVGVDISGKQQTVIHISPQYPAEGSWTACDSFMIVTVPATMAEVQALGDKVMPLDQAMAQSKGLEGSFLLGRLKNHVLERQNADLKEKYDGLLTQLTAARQELCALQKQVSRNQVVGPTSGTPTSDCGLK